jgi:hypothetical protein
MTEGPISTLALHSLTERLRSLAGEERHVQADFLVHLDALDRRRGYAELGYPSLWEFCLRALHLREGAAGRRIGAMRVLRRFPSLVEALREGKLCLSTLCVLGPVLTPENVEEVVARAAFRTKAETDAIAAAVKPRVAPVDGVRRLAGERPAKARTASVELAAAVQSMLGPMQEERELPTPAAARETPPEPALAATSGPVDPRPDAGDLADTVVRPGLDVEPLRLEPPPRRVSRAEVRAVAESQWSLRVTLDGEAKRDLETLTNLLAHTIPDGNLAAVLKEALRCAIEKHGVRRGMLAPGRKKPSPRRQPADSTAPPVLLAAPTGASQQNDRERNERRACGQPPRADQADSSASISTPRASQPADRPTIPAEVRRQVWGRDGGRCTFVARDGTRCESRWRLELDHVQPWALGGSSTADDLRLRCRAHNLFHAEEVFGREHMERFRRRGTVALFAGDASDGGA